MLVPEVTVLMSVYNATEHFGEAVRSILSQSLTEFEFLIIDDGSTEPLEEVMGSLQDDRVRIVRQDNRGLARSLNRGLRLAKGEYIARMDADDVSVSERLEFQKAELDADPGLDLVGSYFEVIDAAGNRIDLKEPFVDPIYRLWRLQFHNNYGHGSVMLRKDSVVRAGMYDEDLRYAQDYDLWSRLSTKSNTKMIPRALYRYRMIADSDQASVRNYDSQLANAIRISDRNLMACNPRLRAEDCVHVRSLYWRFQLKDLSLRGLASAPETLEGFCRRYRVEGEEKQALFCRVAGDVLEEIDRFEPSVDRELDPVVAKIIKWCYTYT